MIQDRGPAYNLGFGVNSRNIGVDRSVQQGDNPSGGVISNALKDHPVLRFFAVTGATLAATAVASQTARKGGVKLFAKIQESGIAPTLIKDARQLRDILDDFQGTVRTAEAYSAENASKLFWEDPQGNIRYGKQLLSDGRAPNDELINLRGWYQTYEEKKAAARYGKRGIDSVADWTIKDELRQKAVMSARRLPYELPAAYIAQRGVTDRLFNGQPSEKDKVNWANPVDVISDFVTQSAKNAAFMFSPLDLGQAAASQGLRQALSYGDDLARLTKAQRVAYQQVSGARDLLQEVGHDLGSIANSAINYSRRSTGSFATAIKVANDNQVGVVDFLNWYRHGTREAIDQAQFKGMNKAQVWGEKARIFLNLDGALSKLPMSPLDSLPGPFKGMYSGMQAASKEWTSIEEQQKALSSMLAKGRQAFMRDADDKEKRALNEALYGGGSPIEELLGSLDRLSHGQPVMRNGRVNPAWKNGEFYQNRVYDIYNARLRQELRDAGLNEDAIARFHQVVGVTAPTHSAHITSRFRLGGKALQMNSDQEVYSYLAGELKVANPQDFIKGMSTAVTRADQLFNSKNFKNVLDDRITNEWNLFYNETVPRLGESILGKAKMPYQMFNQGSLTVERQKFLTRKTAELTGLRMRNDVGDIVSDAMVEDHLRRIGLDPRNFGALRAQLVTRKAISKPWNKNGYNLLGYRAVGVEEALDKGYFRTTDKRENEIRGLIKTMGARDPVSPMGKYNVGGLYQSINGELLDFNSVRRGVRRFNDKLADEFQIPLIHLMPLKTMGYSGFRNMRERSMIQYVSGNTKQPFLTGADNSDFMMWTRATARGSKGNVASFKWGQDGLLREHVLPGKYRPISTVANTIEAHQVKIASGNLGHLSAPLLDANGDPRQPTKWEKFKRAFNISDHQPDSAFGWFGRFRNRHTDINNPIVFSKLLSGETVEARSKRLQLDVKRGVIYDLAQPIGSPERVAYDAQAVAGAFDRFPDLFRARGIPRKLEFESPFWGDTFQVNLRKGVPGGIVGPGSHNLADMKSQAQLIEFARLTAEQHLEDAGTMATEVQTSVRRAQKLLVYRHISNEPGAAYWDTSVPGISGTISTREDQFRADFQKYLITMKGIMGGKEKGGFERAISDMSQQLDSMKRRGMISKVQYIEARAALLGTQLDYSNLVGYNPKFSTLKNTQTAMQHFVNVGGSLSHDLIGDVSSGKYESMAGSGWQGRFGKVMPFFKRHFGTAPYKYSGIDYDPFGGNIALTPTFATAFARNPRGAVASVLGMNTWSNREAFSGSSILSGHLVDRLNKGFGFVGLSLDPTKYKSPMDMYARGLVGQRVLPLVAAGTTAVALDRTAGGFVNPKDEQGNRVYSPLVLGGLAKGVAYGQAAMAGIMPGGQTFDQKRDEIFNGEVPIRSGRWWPLGNTPWKGGRIEYFRPSWYRRLKSGYAYTDQTYGSPLERLAFGYDFSPLRPLDPYRFEREHYADRPYPSSGEYFTGPWGPLRSVLNSTVGRVLKPQIKMHQKEVEAGLSQYLPTGEQGAYFAAPGSAGAMSLVDGGGMGMGIVGPTSGKSGIFLPASGSVSAAGSGMAISRANAGMAAAGRMSPATGRNISFGSISSTNAGYAAAAYSGTYGPAQAPGAMSPRIIGGAPPTSTRNIGYQSRQLGYELQEMAGIYGFAFGAVRESLGFGNQDLTTPRPVLDSAGRAYGSTRGFWSLGLGGLGDVPSPLEGNFANIEFSEIIRRFIPRERSGTEFINPISNTMGQQFPWLPNSASGYYIDFSKGDPYTKVSEGEMRLPGQGYERLHQLHPDRYGKYGLADIHKILGDVAPWSQEYRRIDRTVGHLGGLAGEQVALTREQVHAKAQEHEFTPYEHKYTVPTNLVQGVQRGWELFQHADSPFHTKFMPNRTAVEDWERFNVYGATFPQWQNPIRDFFEPMIYKSTQRDPFQAALVLGGTGTLFGKTSQGKVIGAVVGAGLGFASSMIGKFQEAATGRRYMPEFRRKEVALEEYTDMLTYVKNTHLANMASTMGDMRAASEYKRRASSTLYGVDVYNAPVDQIAQAVPKRKREHFLAMAQAPEQERDRILSTAGRLERRALEAVWGRQVEAKPDLQEYFEHHELPGPGSSVWHPNTSMDQVKIKVGQSMGLDLSQMGYYPQQIREANMVNPAYPSFDQRSSGGDIRTRLRDLMHGNGISGDVQVIRTPYPGTRLEVNAGVY